MYGIETSALGCSGAALAELLDVAAVLPLLPPLKAMPAIPTAAAPAAAKVSYRIKSQPESSLLGVDKRTGDASMLANEAKSAARNWVVCGNKSEQERYTGHGGTIRTGILLDLCTVKADTEPTSNPTRLNLIVQVRPWIKLRGIFKETKALVGGEVFGIFWAGDVG